MNWILALHIIGIIVWMGGLSMLSRLLGFHAEQQSAEVRKTLQRFEHRSYFWAVMAAFALTLGTGLYMLFAKGNGIAHYVGSGSPWGATFHAKLTLVVVLIVLDHLVMRKMKKLHREDEGTKSFFMAVHGVSGVLFMAVVILVKTNLLGG
jgi:uncharacterized integral membrane protein (TIGR00701 family)